MTNPPQPLSVVLPVHNDEQNLQARVDDLLEVLPELSSQFEVLIVDDGSTDQTEEVAYDLARRYPQVRVARHARRRGVEASAKTGVSHTHGDVVIVHAGPQPVNAAQLRKMWQLRNDEELVLARYGDASSMLKPHVLKELVHWGRELRSEQDSDDDGRPDIEQSQSRIHPHAVVPPPTVRFSADSSSLVRR